MTDPTPVRRSTTSRLRRDVAVETLELRRLFADFPVTTLSPTGPGSLDQAVLDANALAGADTITLDVSLAGDIDLGASPLVITDDVDIQGPGATQVFVLAGGDDAGHNRVFEIGSGSADLTVRVAGLTITAGDHDDGGAGLLNSGENVTIEDCVFDSNATIPGNGGAVLNTGGGSLTIRNTLFVNNRADGAVGGGAIYTDGGSINVSNSLFDGNLTSGLAVGGGAVHVADGSFGAANTTFSANSEGNGFGGAIYVAAGASTLLRAVTFADNNATNASGGSGGGLFVAGSAILQNVLFSRNGAALLGGPNDLDRATGATINAARSLIESMPDGTINGTNTNNIVGQPALLGDLADNGGPTLTIAPQAGSPAINAGGGVGDLAFDQRGAGFPRTVGAATDIGAFETDDGSGPVISSPQITAVAPSSLVGSDQVQVITITGTDFNDAATVTLRNETAGQDVTAFTVTEITATQVMLETIFGEAGATWSVTITNPDTGTTGAFTFDVQAAAPKTTVTIGDNQAKSVTYVDGDGTSVTITLKVGTADVVLTGDTLQTTPGPKGTTVSGTNVTIDGIALGATTTARSNLTIKTRGGDGRASLDALTGATPLGKLSAATTDLSGAGIVLTGAGTISTVQLNTIAHNAEVTLPSASLKGVSFKVGNVQGAVITVAGAVKSFTAITLSGRLEAGTIQTLKVAGDLSAEVRASELIRSVTAGTFSSAKILAGVRSDLSTLPTVLADFSNPNASIGSVSVKGKNLGAFGGNSVIAARTIGKVSLGTLNTANDGDAFGVGGDDIASVTATIPATGRLKLSKLTAANQSFASGDFRVNVL